MMNDYPKTDLPMPETEADAMSMEELVERVKELEEELAGAESDMDAELERLEKEHDRLTARIEELEQLCSDTLPTLHSLRTHLLETPEADGVRAAINFVENLIARYGKPLEEKG